jgi:O-antigen/teichoic acid export membrane protein
MKVMAHDIWSRGITETVVTILAFLVALRFGGGQFAPQLGAICGTAASGLVALALAASLFRDAGSAAGFSVVGEAKKLLSFSAPITAYDLINSLIVRLDVIVLGCFIGRAPGVTLPVVGIYGAAVEVAGGLRKVNQIFNPIFAPVIAGLTLDGEQTRAAAAFARVAQWMLWVLTPLAATILLAAPLILGIYGAAFRQGGVWLGIVAIACGTNAFVGLAETVIMVQRPRLNLRNSIICCVLAIAGNVLLIARFGALGAAFGILLPYLVFGFLRYRTLRQVFGWQTPFRNVHPPLVAALMAGVPALVCRLLMNSTAAQVTSVLVFSGSYFVCWRWHRTHAHAPPLG